MYARLNDDYVLRGWDGLPYAVVVRKSGETAFLDGESFDVFAYLDGQSDLDVVCLTARQQAALEQLLKRRAVQVSEEPFPAGLAAPLASYKVYPCRAVTGIQWSITGACNLRCRHCYISAPHYKYHDLDTARCLALVDQMAAAGVASVSLSGGEPLVREDFWIIVDRLLEQGIAVESLLTNALLAGDTFLDEFEKRRLDCPFQVSFDGLGHHDWLRGSRGCEEKTLAALRRLLARGKRVTVTTSLHAGNLDALLPTYELLAGLGVSVWRPLAMSQNGEWLTASAGPDSPRSLPRETLWERYFDLARRYIADGQPFGLQLGPCFAARKGPHGSRAVPAAMKFTGIGEEQRLAQFSCRTCRAHPSLMPDGRLLPCPAITGLKMEDTMPNLLEIPLVEVYNQMERPFFAMANLTVKDVLAANECCRPCPWRLECGGGCRAQAVMAGLGVQGRDPDMCAFFRDGWRERFASLL